MKINEKIRQLREQHQLSQENMADKLGMSVTGYAKIERGEVRSNLPRLEQISEVFDMDICELLSYGKLKKFILIIQSQNQQIQIIQIISYSLLVMII